MIGIFIKFQVCDLLFFFYTNEKIDFSRGKILSQVEEFLNWEIFLGLSKFSFIYKFCLFIRDKFSKWFF